MRVFYMRGVNPFGSRFRRFPKRKSAVWLSAVHCYHYGGVVGIREARVCVRNEGALMLALASAAGGKLVSRGEEERAEAHCRCLLRRA